MHDGGALDGGAATARSAMDAAHDGGAPDGGAPVGIERGR